MMAEYHPPIAAKAEEMVEYALNEVASHYDISFRDALRHVKIAINVIEREFQQRFGE